MREDLGRVQYMVQQLISLRDDLSTAESVGKLVKEEKFTLSKSFTQVDKR